MSQALADYRKWIEGKLAEANMGGEQHLYEDAAFVLDMYLSEKETS